MEKLSKKQFAELLVNSGFHFCAHNKTLQEIIELTKNIEDAKALDIIYTVESCQLRSNDFVMTVTGKSEKCYRDFHGKNTFVKYGDYLLHENINAEYVCTFINVVK